MDFYLLNLKIIVACSGLTAGDPNLERCDPVLYNKKVYCLKYSLKFSYSIQMKAIEQYSYWPPT